MHSGGTFHRPAFVQVGVMALKAIRPPKKDREWPPVILQLLADPDPVSQRCARLLVERMPITCGVVRAVNYNPKGKGLVDLGWAQKRGVVGRVREESRSSKVWWPITQIIGIVQGWLAKPLTHGSHPRLPRPEVPTPPGRGSSVLAR